MELDVNTFETGWFDVTVRLSKGEIAQLIANLKKLQSDSGAFFHIQNVLDNEKPSIANLTFYQSEDHMTGAAEMYPLQPTKG